MTMTMTHRSFWPGLLAAWLLLGGPALAQTAAPGTEQGCRDLLAAFSKAHSLSLTAEKVGAKGAKGCLFGNLRSEAKPTSFTIDTVDVDTIEPDPADSGKLPLSLRLTAAGMRLSGSSGDVAQDYMLQLSSDPLAFSIDYELDTTSKTLKLTAFTFNTRHGALSASAEIARFDPTASEGQSKTIVTRTALKSLEFSLQDEEGEIQRLLLLPVGYTLLRGSADPAARLKQIKDQAAAWLRITLSLTNMPPAQVEDTIAALTDFPKATKPFYLSVKLPQPVGVDDVFRIMIGGATPGELFPDGWINLTYGK